MKAGISVPRSSRRSSSGRMSGASTRNACRKDRGAAATSASSNLSSAVSSSLRREGERCVEQADFDQSTRMLHRYHEPTESEDAFPVIELQQQSRDAEHRRPCVRRSELIEYRAGAPRLPQASEEGGLRQHRSCQEGLRQPVPADLRHAGAQARQGALAVPAHFAASGQTSAASSWTCGSAAWASTSATRLSHASTPARTSRSSATRAMVR